MTTGTRRALARAATFVAGSVILLTACSSPSGTGEDVGPVMLPVTPIAVPAAIDPAVLGWESAGAALEVSPALAESVGDCGVELVAAARQVLGVRCAAEAGPVVLYSDTASGQVWSTSELFTEEGRREVMDGLVFEGATPASEDRTNYLGLLDDVRFDSAGNVVVVTADGAAWQVGSADVAPLLSDSGRLVRGTVRSAGAFSGPLAAAPAGVPVVAAASAQLPPPVSKRTGSGGTVDCTVEKCIAITYDDGPGPYTEKLLDILAARDAKATFYMLGSLVAGRADTVKRMVEEGHDVANHTWSHPDLRTIAADAVARQVSRTTDAVEAASGVAPSTMRPPYGATNATVVDVLARQGLPIIMWSVDTEDWKNRSVSETTSRALSGAHEGAIILFHDIHPSTVDAAPGIIDALQSQGYTLVTISNLLGEMEPGVKYFSTTNP